MESRLKINKYLRFWCGLVENIKYTFTIFGVQLKLLPWNVYTIFVTIDHFVHDLQPKKIIKQTDRQILNCRMATILTMVPLEKDDLSNIKNCENQSVCSKVIDEQTF